MSLQQEVMTALKGAMKAKDQTALTALRAVKSAILLAQTESGAKEELTEEQQNQRTETRNAHVRRQLIPRSDVPQTEGRRESPRYIVERSNSPVLNNNDDDESNFNLSKLIFI